MVRDKIVKWTWLLIRQVNVTVESIVSNGFAIVRIGFAIVHIRFGVITTLMNEYVPNNLDTLNEWR